MVGRHSFLAQHALGALAPAEALAVGHDQIERPDLFDGIGCVVNFSRHPMAATDAYRLEQMDTDLRLARRIGHGDISYVMLSSRKVYAPSDAPRRKPLRPPRATRTGATSSPSSEHSVTCSASA